MKLSAYQLQYRIQTLVDHFSIAENLRKMRCLEANISGMVNIFTKGRKGGREGRKKRGGREGGKEDEGGREQERKRGRKGERKEERV